MRILDVTVQPRRNSGRFIQERSPRRANKQGYRLLGNAPPKTTSNHNSISECSSLPSRNLRRLGRRRRRLRSRHTNTYGKHNYSKPGRGQMATLTTDLLKARPGPVGPGEQTNYRLTFLKRSAGAAPRRPSLGPRYSVAQKAGPPPGPYRLATRYWWRWRILHVSLSLLHTTQMGRC